MPKGGFGSVESRRSKTNNKIVGARARYWGPDGKRYTRTFGDKLSAQIWLVEERKLVDRGEWRPPNQREVVRKLTLSAWASEYVESRTLAPATRRNYVRWLAVYVDPSIGRKYVDEVTIADVAAWHAQMKSELRRRARASGRTNGDGAGEASQVYKLLSGVFKAAVAVGLIDSSPARVAGAGRYRRHRTPVVLTPAEVEAMARALPEKYRALADVMSWTGLRIGEARALRRRDVDVRDPDAASITVAQNVSQGGKAQAPSSGDRRPRREAGPSPSPGTRRSARRSSWPGRPAGPRRAGLPLPHGRGHGRGPVGQHVAVRVDHRAREGRPARHQDARPAAHQPHHGGPCRCDDGRAHAPRRPQRGAGRDDLPARLGRAGSHDHRADGRAHAA